MVYFDFLAHYKPKETSSPKVKNMVNFSYLSMIRKWTERMSNIEIQHVNFSLSTIKWGGRGRIGQSLNKGVKESVLIDNLVYAKICSKNVIYLMSVFITTILCQYPK